MNTFEQLFMNRNDDKSITYIAYKGAILLVLLILIFNADQIAANCHLCRHILQHR